MGSLEKIIGIAVKVLFVCLGNICRSPTAHAVFRNKALQSGLNVEVESAGTSAYHEGNRPDTRSMAAGQKRGYDFNGIVSRKVRVEDFDYYDLILAMDKDNLRNLLKICPNDSRHKIKLMLEFSEQYALDEEVPDPYYGGGAGFELVLDMIEDASAGLLVQVKSEMTTA